MIIDDIIVHWMTSRYRRQRNILRDRGVTLLTGLLKLQGLIETTHAQAMVGLTDTTGKFKLSSVALEDIQDTIGCLEKRRKKISECGAMFGSQKEVKKLISLSGAQLEDRMRKALELLESYQNKVERLARDIGDCLADA